MTASRKLLVLLTAAALTMGLAACGKQGQLERPAPLWGAAEKAKYEAEKRAASANANKTTAPNTVQENTDPATSSANTRQAPQKGTNPDPFGGPSGPGFPNSGPQ